jgi:two-component system, cell cycle sensor histidine kinase and response regulator CckA
MRLRVGREREIRGVELKRKRKDGEAVWVLADIVGGFSAGGELTEIRCYLHDITDQRRVESHLVRSQKMEAVGHLAGGVAHDFNNLLGVIGSYAEMAQREIGPAHRAAPRLDAIRKAVERATAVTRQLLTFSRRQPAEARACDLNAIVEGIELMVRRLIGEDMRLVVALDPRPLPLWVDPGQVEQVITNLAVNARDAMPNGGHLVVETSTTELDERYARLHPEARTGHHAVLAVTDTGIGMDEATLARVFEPFFTTKEMGKGTGLGLSVVYGIVKRFGGHIAVYSEPSRGTSFKVYLPIAQTAVIPSAAPSEPVPPPMGGTETVLVVEDEAALRSVIGELLREAGYTVLEAGDGAEAVRLASSADRIDLLLTDVVLTQSNGSEVAQAVSSRHPFARTVFMSGYPDRAVNGFQKILAGESFLQKPFSETALLHRLREVLDAPPAVGEGPLV